MFASQLHDDLLFDSIFIIVSNIAANINVCSAVRSTVLFAECLNVDAPLRYVHIYMRMRMRHAGLRRNRLNTKKWFVCRLPSKVYAQHCECIFL